MLLNEFIYFNETDLEQVPNNRYDPSHDKSILSIKDTRKTRLTLGMLRDLRKAGEARDQEQMEELAVVRLMYATPTEPAQ